LGFFSLSIIVPLFVKEKAGHTTPINSNIKMSPAAAHGSASKDVKKESATARLLGSGTFFMF
jgi:hypothetical protein